MIKVPITAPGLEALQVELKQLKSIERPAVIKAIAEAREHGDLSENAEYHAARDRQGMIEARIGMLEDRISRADVIDVSKLTGETVMFGATVELIDLESEERRTFTIVGADESDAKAGRLSVTSPIARAIIGRAPGDSVEVVTPAGQKDYEIVSVTYG